MIQPRGAVLETPQRRSISVEFLRNSMARDLPIKLTPEGMMTNLKNLTTPTTLVAAFLLAAAPSYAQQKYHGRENSGQPQQQQQPAARGQERAQPRSEAPRAQAPSQPQAQQARPQAAAPPPVQSRQAVPRAQQQPRVEVPRADNRRGDERRNERADDHRNRSGAPSREGMSDRAAAFTVHVIRRVTHRACTRPAGHASAFVLSSVCIPAALLDRLRNLLWLPGSVQLQFPVSDRRLRYARREPRW